ncbi:MAG: hypothetical protein ACR2IE_11395 [Candidatus Sumerlaeaceae bacterium]
MDKRAENRARCGGYGLRAVVFAIAGVLLGLSGDSAQAQERGFWRLTYPQDFEYNLNAWWNLPLGWRSDTSIPSDREDWANPNATQQAYPNTLTPSSSGGTYIFKDGGVGAEDECLGILASGTYTAPRNIFYALKNDIGSTITDISLGFTYEWYRNGTKSVAYNVYYGYTADNIHTPFPGAGISLAAGADSNTYNPPQEFYTTSSVTGISIPPGGNFYLRWNYSETGTGTSKAIGIDDITVRYTDTFAPTMQILSDPHTASTGPEQFAVFYDDDQALSAITLSADDVTLVTTGDADADVETYHVYDNMYYVELTNITGNGSIAIRLAAGTAVDTSGNLAPAADSPTAYVVDTNPPVVTATGPVEWVGQEYSEPQLRVPFTVTDDLAMGYFSDYLEVESTPTLSSYWTTLSEDETTTYITLDVLDDWEGELAAFFPIGFAQDAAGNSSARALAFSGQFDFKAPQITDISVTPTLVAAGTTVTISFTSNEPLDTTFTAVWVLLPYESAATFVGVNGTRYTYEWFAHEFYAGINADVGIGAIDLIHNFTSEYLVNAFTVVAADTTPPDIYNVSASPGYAKLGDQVAITFYATEELSENPEVSVDNESASFTSKDGSSYTYTYPVTETSPEGGRLVSVSATDLANNVGGYSSPYSAFYVDRTLPFFSTPSVVPAYVRADGNPASITFESSEYVAAPTATVGGEPANFAYGNGQTHSLLYYPTPGAIEGARELVVTGVDGFGNEGITTFPAALTIDNTSPVLTVGVDDQTVVGTEPFAVHYAEQPGGGSPMTSASLYVRPPHLGEFVPVNDAVGIQEYPGTFMFSAPDNSYILGNISGVYEFASIAADEAGNVGLVPTTAQTSVTLLADPGTSLTLDVPAGNSQLVFPLSDDLDVTITLTGVTSGGTITLLASNLPSGEEPSYFRNPAQLLKAFLTIIAGGGLTSGSFTASIEWAFDEVLAPAGGIDTVYQFEGDLSSPMGVYTVQAVGGSGKLKVTGVNSFSSWYAGNATAVPVSVSRFELE